MEEKGVIKMSNYIREEKSSQWVLHEGTIKFKTETTKSEFDFNLREFIKGKPTITYETPQERGYLKQVEFYIISSDEIPSMKKRGLKEKVFFKEKVIAKVKDDNPHMYILLNSDGQTIQDTPTPVNQFYLKDVNRGLCMKMPLNSNDYVQITKEEPEAITAKEATELSKKYSYIFDAVENENGEDLYRQNVSRFIDRPM